MNARLAGRNTKGQPKERPKEKEKNHKGCNGYTINLISYSRHHLTITMHARHASWVSSQMTNDSGSTIGRCSACVRSRDRVGSSGGSG